MKRLVEMIARSLVDHPDQVEVTEVRQDDQTRLELRVAESDLGKVIGRQGRTARAIRTLVATAAERGDQGDVAFEIVE